MILLSSSSRNENEIIPKHPPQESKGLILVVVEYFDGLLFKYKPARDSPGLPPILLSFYSFLHFIYGIPVTNLHEQILLQRAKKIYIIHKNCGVLKFHCSSTITNLCMSISVKEVLCNNANFLFCIIILI